MGEKKKTNIREHNQNIQVKKARLSSSVVWKKNVVSMEAANRLVKEEDLNEKWTAWSLFHNTSLPKSVMTES